MTTVRKCAVQCALCKKESSHRLLTSCSTFGYPDLDFRPAPMSRNTMEYWTQECPNCGYVNGHLEHPCALSRETLSDIYKEVESAFDWRQLPANDWPIIAIRFAKLGAMHVKLNDYISAAEQFLRVAWKFDDYKNEQAASAAVFWRKKAIECAEFEINKHSPDTEELVCIYADMLRRVGHFESVLKLDESQLSDDIYIQLIKYQKKLSLLEDSAPHKIDECGYISAANTEKITDPLFL